MIEVSTDLVSVIEKAMMEVRVIRCGCGKTEYEENHQCPNPTTEIHYIGEYTRPQPTMTCECCGESEEKFLSCDEDNDNQILCHNCNVAKALYGICPHQEKEGD